MIKVLLLVKIAFFLCPPSATALPSTLAYDQAYDNASASLNTVACSDGKNGLITRGYKTFGSLPTFPNIAAVQDVEGYDSVYCGSCWEVTYTTAGGKNKTANVLAVDRASKGIVMGLKAANTLTNGQAGHWGRVNVAVKRAADSVCGLESHLD